MQTVKFPIKKIIPCIDVKDGRVVKGIKFKDNIDVASPVDLARKYCNEGADELVFYEITAAVSDRKPSVDVLKQVINVVTIPLTVGGGIYTIEDFANALEIGADKVSINTGVIKNPDLITEAANKFGSKCVVFAVDVKEVDGNYHIFTRGGREDTGIDAIKWIKQGEQSGAGELVVNSIDTDGVKGGFDIKFLQTVCDAVSIPVTASGGAGCIQDFINLFTEVPNISAGLAASVFHFNEVKIPELKQVLSEMGL